MSLHHRLGSLIVLSVLGLAAAGCGGQTYSSGGSGSGSGGSDSGSGSGGASSSAPTSPSATAPSATASDSSSSSASSSASSGQASGVPIVACTASTVRFTVKPDGGAAGTSYYRLRMVNASSAPCATYGYPGVSLVGGGQGKQIGAAAERDPGPKMSMTIPAGGHTTTTVRVGNAMNYPRGRCRPEAGDGFRVYPPDQRAAAFVKVPNLTGCANRAVTLLGVKPFSRPAA